jgi:hypothetical protein
MKEVKTKVILREYPKPFQWEKLEDWNIGINEAIKDLDVLSVSPIGFNGVLMVYVIRSSDSD